jgi:DNA polymerase III delta prime subunit
METNDRQFLWVEKYRPTKIADCILPEAMKKTFVDIVASGSMPNMIFSGRPGIGKTTVARALCEEMDRDYLFVPASEQGNIETLRYTVRQYAGTMAFNGKPKAVIFDEGDGMTKAAQDALRSFIEEFSVNCNFIFTANNKGKIAEAIRESRLVPVDFTIPKVEKATLARQFFERAKEILDSEKIVYDPKAVTQIVLRNFPDFRKILNQLQYHSKSGTLVFEEGVGTAQIKEVIDKLAEKDMSFVRQWVAQNAENDTQHIYRRIYDVLYDRLVPSTIPDAIVALAKYQHWAITAANQEINLMACLVEIAVVCQFK